MKNALILTYSGFQDQEVVYPYYRLLGDGFKVDVVADKKDNLGRFYGILGVNMPCTVLYAEFNKEISRFENEYDFLVIPGGVKSLEKLRQIHEVLDFITKWNKDEKIIASTCHGAQLLISSKIVKGRDITGYPSLKDDLVNAGANYKTNPVVVDKNVVSSPHYDFMGEWMEIAIKNYYMLKK